MKKAGIFSNKKRDTHYKGALLLAKVLRLRGISVYFDADCMPEGESDAIDYADIDCLFVFGGDGTILRANAKASCFGIPMLGINMGRLGFLTEVEVSEISRAVDEIIAGRFYIEQRLMLRCTVMNGEKTVLTAEALNDAALQKKDVSRTIQVEVHVNDALADSVACDGMLVATPTGSTAYSLSAGGPIVSPSLECMLVTPVSPHTLHSRTMVVSADDRIDIRPKVGGSVMFSVDGTMIRNLKRGETVRIGRSEHIAYFIRFREGYFYSLLRSKFLNWDW